LCLHPWNTQN